MAEWWTDEHMSQVPRELMVPVRYLRFCPVCEDFQPQTTTAEGEDRILRCEACGSSERFVMSNGVLVPEGTLALMRSFARKRAREVLLK